MKKLIIILGVSLIVMACKKEVITPKFTKESNGLLHLDTVYYEDFDTPEHESALVIRNYSTVANVDLSGCKVQIRYYELGGGELYTLPPKTFLEPFKTITITGEDVGGSMSSFKYHLMHPIIIKIFKDDKLIYMSDLPF